MWVTPGDLATGKPMTRPTTNSRSACNGNTFPLTVFHHIAFTRMPFRIVGSIGPCSSMQFVSESSVYLCNPPSSDTTRHLLHKSPITWKYFVWTKTRRGTCTIRHHHTCRPYGSRRPTRNGSILVMTDMIPLSGEITWCLLFKRTQWFCHQYLVLFSWHNKCS